MSEKCKGQRICMSRDAHEALHVQLEAKDAEIAELRARAHMLGGELREADLRAESYLQERSKAVSERDEARECVRKLYAAAKRAATSKDDYEWVIDPDSMDALESAVSATPPHLR